LVEAVAAPVAAPEAEKPDHAPIRVSADEYMERYAHDSYEWVKGELIKMSPVSLPHDQLTIFLRDLFRAYLTLNPIGQVVGAPFVMRMDAVESRREPDLQIILEGNPGQLTQTAMIGAADIAIEIVSPESVARDYGDKFEEYEKGGVREYWLFDPERKTPLFWRLRESGLYERVSPDADGYYRTPLLPNFALHVPTLWADDLPDILQIVEMVRGWFADTTAAE
jgi:Uma2 family endonuclease